MNADWLLAHYERIADAPEAVPRLRRFILALAVRGKLAKQDPNDEPASELLKKIAAEKARLVKVGEIKKQSAVPLVATYEALFSVPNVWKWTRIGSAAYVEMGQSPPSEHYNRTGHGIPFFQGKADFGKRYPTARYWCTQPKKYAAPGDILISVRAPVGPTNVASEPCCIGRGLAALRSHNGIDRYYLLRCLEAFEHALAALGFGTTFVAINKNQLTAFVIPLPPLAEQRRIVAKVDELMALCDRIAAARTEREATRDQLSAASLVRLDAPDPNPVVFQNHAAFALENLVPLTTRTDQIKALRQTILNLAVRGKLVEQDPNDDPAAELLKRIAAERAVLVKQRQIRREKALNPIDPSAPPFEVPAQWVWSRLGDAVLFTQYGTSRKAHPGASGIPVLTMGNIQDGMVVWKNQKRIPESSNDLPALYLRKFDILYNRTNSAELVGKTGIYLGEDDCMTFASYLIRIRTSETVGCPQYLNLAMNTLVFRTTQIMPLIKKQTGQANVNGTALKNMLVPLPPLPEQHRIITRVDELIALCARLEASLATGEDTRHRLLDALLREVLMQTADWESVVQRPVW